MPIGSQRANPSPARHVTWGSLILLVLLSGGLAACNSTRSFERSSDGSMVYFDQLSDAAKSQARLKLAADLRQAVSGAYDLEVSDEIEVFFYVNREPTAAPYDIRVSDKLRIEFLGDTDSTRIVDVRPDGQISLPLVGPIKVAGETADALAHELERRYAKTLNKPQITVNVTESHTPLDDFITALGTPTKGRSIIVKVLPDGTISLPLLPPLKAHASTVKQLESEIDAAYAARGLTVFVSLIPRTLRAGSTFVLGEVGKPGRIQLDRPKTVLMALAEAGGIQQSGAMSAVRVVYVSADGIPRVRLVNLDDVLEGRAEEDMIVPDDSVIFVPTTTLAKTTRLMDAVVRDILRFQGFSIGGAYLINQSTSGTTVVPNQ